MNAKEMIEKYCQQHKKYNTPKVLVVKRGLIAKIKNFCYNFFRR